MAELTPLFMDIENVYSGDELGLPLRHIMGEGIVLSADLAVTGGAGNSVNVAAGGCYVKGDTNLTRQPTYFCANDAVVNKGINPDPANPRRVLVVAQIIDETFAGVGRKWEIQVIHGAPAAVPALPATPASALPLANVLVPAAAASSAAYTITNLRKRAVVGGGDAAAGGIAAKIRRDASGPQLIPNLAGTYLVPDAVDLDFDTGGFFNPATPSRLTIPEAGIYGFAIQGSWAGQGTGTRELSIHINRVFTLAYHGQSPPPGVTGDANVVHQRAEWIHQFAAGDYIEGYVVQNSGLALNFAFGDNSFYQGLSIWKIGAVA